MRFFTRVAVLFYVTIVLFISVLMLAYVLHWLDIKSLWMTLYAGYVDYNLRVVFGTTGAVLLLINFIFYNMFTVNIHREKIIAFDNPSGRITVSLIAIEDIVKRTVLRVGDVKDVKPMIKATKKGLRVRIKLVLCSEVNIPEFTHKIQNIVKDKIQDMIGLDESLTISVYVNKIVSSDNVDMTEDENASSDNEDSPVPFRGYRA